ncbi:MAG: hypothetical protein DRN26_02840 [Thermoplasmata archaeon]|nr:MAG: hypothetical protein DRN26_02840 [Thermoplasmata archaeon]
MIVLTLECEKGKELEAIYQLPIPYGATPIRHPDVPNVLIFHNLLPADLINMLDINEYATYIKRTKIRVRVGYDEVGVVDLLQYCKDLQQLASRARKAPQPDHNLPSDWLY